MNGRVRTFFRTHARTVARVIVPIVLLIGGLMSAHSALFCWWAAGAPPSLASPRWVMWGNGWCGSSLALGFLAAGSIYWLRPRAVPAGICAHCHYDRTGLAPTTPCPECGTPTKLA